MIRVQLKTNITIELLKPLDKILLNGNVKGVYCGNNEFNLNTTVLQKRGTIERLSDAELVLNKKLFCNKKRHVDNYGNEFEVIENMVYFYTFEGAL
jgi:hypothetical protein